MGVFTETNPDKGTETFKYITRHVIADIVFTETNPDKGTETKIMFGLSSFSIYRVYRN